MCSTEYLIHLRVLGLTGLSFSLTRPGSLAVGLCSVVAQRRVLCWSDFSPTAWFCLLRACTSFVREWTESYRVLAPSKLSHLALCYAFWQSSRREVDKTRRASPASAVTRVRNSNVGLWLWACVLWWCTSSCFSIMRRAQALCTADDETVATRSESVATCRIVDLK